MQERKRQSARLNRSIPGLYRRAREGRCPCQVHARIVHNATAAMQNLSTINSTVEEMCDALEATLQRKHVPVMVYGLGEAYQSTLERRANQDMKASLAPATIRADIEILKIKLATLDHHVWKVEDSIRNNFPRHPIENIHSRVESSVRDLLWIAEILH